MEYLKYTLAAAALVLLAFFAQNVSRPPQPAQGSFEARTDEQGQVTIKVTPLALEGAEWKFGVVFDTHSVDLDDDPMQITVLSDNRGNEYKPLAWEGPGPGGHHREGVLVFEASPPTGGPTPSSVELKIKNVGGVAERVFRW